MSWAVLFYINKSNAKYSFAKFSSGRINIGPQRLRVFESVFHRFGIITVMGQNIVKIEQKRRILFRLCRRYMQYPYMYGPYKSTVAMRTLVLCSAFVE